MENTCCFEMKENLAKENMIFVMENFPFTKKPLDTPQIWIFSDGGHGGGFPIKYCPFCGKKIQIDLKKLVF